MMKNKASIIEKITEILIFLTLFLYYNFNQIQYKELYIYYFPIIALFLIYLIKVIVNKKIEFSKHIIWYIIFFGYTAFSLIWCKDLSFSLRNIKNFLFTLLFILSLDNYIKTDENRIFKLIKINTLALIIMIFRIAMKEPFIYSLNRIDYFGYSIGFYKNNLGLSLAFNIMLLIYTYIRTKNKKYLLFIPLFMYVILLSNSRKSLIFPILCIIIFLILNSIKNNKLKTKNLLLIISVMLLVLLAVNSIPEIKTRFQSALNTFSSDIMAGDESAIERRFYRNTSVELFKEKPILGFGVNGFAQYLNSIDYSHVAYSHNNWLELLSTLGVVGFCIYYYQYLYIFNKLFKYRTDINGLYLIIFVIGLFILDYILVSYYILNNQFILLIIFKCSDILRKK